MLGHNQYDWLKVVYNHKPDVGYQNIVHMGIQEGMSAIYVKLDDIVFKFVEHLICGVLRNVVYLYACLAMLS